MAETRNVRAGVDLGGTKIQAALVGARDKVLGEARRQTPTTGPDDIAAEIAGAVRDALAKAELEPAALAGVGVGAPGDVDAAAGSVMASPNLPTWDGPYPLAEKLRRLLGIPAALGNDVQVATDAEFKLGAGRPYRSLIGVFWGTGIGGGIVLDGRPWVGRGAAAEFGHMVVRQGGRRCMCGRRGCVEAYAGRSSMEMRARRDGARGRRTVLFEIMEKRGRDRLTSGVWAKALDQGDKLATELIDRAVQALGAGIASALNVLDVEAVVIGGGLGERLGQPYVDRIREAMMPHLFADHRPPAVLLAELGDLAGAIGGSLLVKPSRPWRPRAEKASETAG
jgi:glucokinase